MRSFVRTVSAVFTLLLFVSLSPAAQQTTPPAPLKIGFVADQSGVGYLFSVSQIAGLEIAVEEINAAGGILGRPVEFIVRDAQLKADVGATLARQMILEDGVELLLGPTSSSVALAVSAVAKEYKIPIAFHTSNSYALTTTQGHPYVVQVIPNTYMEGRAAAQYMAQFGYTQWASIGPDYAYGRDHFAGFSTEILALDEEAVFLTEQWPALGERDLSPFISAVQAAAPQAVYTSLWGDQFVTFVQQSAPLGLLEDAALIGLLDTDFLKAVGEDLPEGVYGFSRAPFYAIDTPQMAEFIEKHLDKMDGEYPSDWAILTYDAVYALKAAVEAAGSTEGDAVAAALDDLTFTSLRGELTIRACDHMANAPDYIGVATQDSPYGYPIMKDVVQVAAEDVWYTCEEVAELRGEQ
jgi:branched-chain amino acid transport system substrate-binding protein